MLIIFGGLPGTGKTAIASDLARQIGAMQLRIDTIEQAILTAGLTNQPINEAGYLSPMELPRITSVSVGR